MVVKHYLCKLFGHRVVHSPPILFCTRCGWARHNPYIAPPPPPLAADHINPRYDSDSSGEVMDVHTHASRHAAGGADPIISTLELAAIPGIHQIVIADDTTDTTTTTTNFVNMEGASATITTSGNPVLVIFVETTTNDTSDGWVYARLKRDTTTLEEFVLGRNGKDDSGRHVQIYYDTPPAGTYTYRILWKVNVGTGLNSPTTDPGRYRRRLILIELKR